MSCTITCINFMNLCLSRSKHFRMDGTFVSQTVAALTKMLAAIFTLVGFLAGMGAQVFRKS